MKSILFIEARTPDGNLPLSILSRAGYLVFTAPTAREALARARRGDPDLDGTGEPAEPPAGETLLKALRRYPALTETPILALRPPDPEPAAGGGPPGEPAWDTPPLDGPPVDGAPDEIVRTPVNPFELIAKVRFLLNEEIRRPPPRLWLKQEAELEAGEIHARGSLLNVSGSGALMEARADELPEILPEGRVRLRFRLPESGLVLEPVGRVIRRVEEPGAQVRIALEFLDMDPDAQRALESFLFLNG